MRHLSKRTAIRLAEELAALSALNRSGLQARWRACYGMDPPARVSRALMIRAVAYKLQEKAIGGLTAATARALAAANGHEGTQLPAHAVPRRLGPGSVLVREWRGASHRVTVLESGMLYRGVHYRSLSEIARRITGSRWSGPKFFGLKDVSRDPAQPAA